MKQVVSHLLPLLDAISLAFHSSHQFLPQVTAEFSAFLLSVHSDRMQQPGDLPGINGHPRVSLGREERSKWPLHPISKYPKYLMVPVL